MMTRSKPSILLACGVLITLVVAGVHFAPRAAAQDNSEIQYNDPAIVTLTPGTTITKTFAVLPGDTVEIKLSRLAEFTYTAVLLDPNQSANPLQPGADGNVTVMIENAPLSGVYSLVLQASAGTGDLLIQVNSNSIAPTSLPIGQVTLDTSSTYRYELVPPAGMPETTLTLQAAPGLTLPGLTLVNGATGATVLTLSGGQLPIVALTLPAQQPFLLSVEPSAVPQELVVNWGQGQVSITGLPPSTGSNTGTNTSSTGANTSSTGSTGNSQNSASQSYNGPCQMVFSGQVNVRSGPSTAYEPPIGQAQAGSAYPVTGHDGSYGWYQIAYNGQNGWVSGQIDATELQGNCSTVQAATYPSAPQPAQQSGQPNANYTPTYTYTPSAGQPQQQQSPPTATYTPPAAQVAPPDSNYVIRVPLDGNATQSDYVSYPGGDVEDVVSYDVTGLNNNVAASGGQADLTFQLLCDGTGSEYINFRIDGRDYACYDVFTRRVNADSRTGAIRVQALGGSATYVQWTVIGNAPRTN